MTQTFIISELIFLLIGGIGFFVVKELIRSKDGELRKIMIAYYSSIVFMYGFAAVYFIWPSMMDLVTFRIIVCLPKAASMLWLYSYLRRNQKT